MCRGCVVLSEFLYTVASARIALRCNISQCKQCRLFLAKADRLLNSDGEFLVERLERLIRGEIKTVETMSLLAVAA